jgi:ATP-dependent helicase/nuclease subunit B
LGWDRPLVAAVVDYLASDWRGGVLDLSDRLIVVPTRQSGRRLREALAERAAERGSAVFPPQVLTPEAFLTVVRPDGLPVATPAEAALMWVAVLGGVDLNDFPALFPQVPPRTDVEWALHVAEAWQAVRQTLGEGGMTMAAAAERLTEADHPEAARWRDLARLETMYLARLAAVGRDDAQTARQQAAVAPVMPPGVARLDLVAVSDPMESAVTAAACCGAAGIAVTVLVAAPRDREDSFDVWGRPDPAVWAVARDLPLPLENCHLVDGPTEQAAMVRSLAAGHADPAATLGLGVADPEVAAALVSSSVDNQDTSFEKSMICYLPEGVSAGDHELWHVLDGLARLLREPSFRALGQWLRFPPVSALLRRRAGLAATVTQADLLDKWDQCTADHLPQSLQDGRLLSEGESGGVVHAVITAAMALLDECACPPVETAVASVLTSMYGARSFPQASPEGAVFCALARELSGCLRQTSAAATMAGLELTPAAQLGIVLPQLRLIRMEVGDRPDEAVDVNGWLELAWESAPHVVLAGLNDGFVPDAVVGDPYLPESLRSQLGLKRGNAARFARDAHLLHGLLASRRVGGRVDLVLGRNSAAGDVLRPSRLLFLRPDDELADRALALFGGGSISEAASLPARRLAWRLRVPAPRLLSSVGVTSFRDYLACPFRFYLRHGLGMKPVDLEPRELDAMGFGVLCHAALKDLAHEPGLGVCTDVGVIADFLRDRLRVALGRTHGAHLTIPLRVQLASAGKRLAAFARWQAQSVRDGWRTEHTEVSFAEMLGGPWMVGGLEVRGRIDRIDRRGGEWRIIDYKTSDAARKVKEVHLGTKLSGARALEERPRWQVYEESDGKLFAWRDLQLPLYALAARQAYGVVPEVGYFHLVKAAEECAYENWSELDESLLEEAHGCALGVVEAISRRVFWPPGEGGSHDAFARLLRDDPLAAVDPTALLSL